MVTLEQTELTKIEKPFVRGLWMTKMAGRVANPERKVCNNIMTPMLGRERSLKLHQFSMRDTLRKFPISRGSIGNCCTGMLQ